MTRKLAPVHPGEILRDEFLTPLHLTPYSVAKALGVPRTRSSGWPGKKRRSLPTRRYGWRAISVSRRRSGSICKANMIWSGRRKP
jgi:hypothetical protein